MTLNALEVIEDVLKRFREHDPEMQMQTAQTFITVALNPGISMTELSEKVGISQASCSRNVAALSRVHRLNKPGLDLVVAAEDPMERRRKVVKLTPKGQRLAEALTKLLAGG